MRPKLVACVLIVVAMIIPSVTAKPQKKHKEKRQAEAVSLPEVIWKDPGDVGAMNMLYGAGGRADAPDPAAHYTFVQEDMQGGSPKFDVDDDHGVHWKVKLGQESQSETAATRLLWSAGYFVDEDYYVPQLKVEGLPELRRGREFVSSDGTVQGARLERKRKDARKLGDWKWFSNPFLGTREFNGLRVMMSLLNNWDLKDDNNSVYEMNGERVYVVADAGATLGNTGSSITRSKSNPKEYTRSAFIAKAGPDSVDFVMHSRPIFLSAFDAPHFVEYSRMEKVTKHIPRADAKWLGQRLAMLSDVQLRDCFRAAGYNPDEIDIYTYTVRDRITELNGL